MHATKHFPDISANILCTIAFVFSLLFRLKEVIVAIIAMRFLVQFIGQTIGLLLLAERKGQQHFAWKMPLFTLPIHLAIAIWDLF